MEIMEGSSFSLPDSSWLKLEIRVNELDLQQLLVEWGLDPEQTDISLAMKYQILSVLAQRLTAMRATLAGGMSQEDFDVVIERLNQTTETQKKALGIGETDG